jgi:hypothetical protein
MDFDPSEYVQRGSSDDRFPDGEAKIAYCRFCRIAMLLRPDDAEDCGMHLN